MFNGKADWLARVVALAFFDAVATPLRSIAPMSFFIHYAQKKPPAPGSLPPAPCPRLPAPGALPTVFYLGKKKRAQPCAPRVNLTG